jgi:hypothetical protein
MSFRSFFGLLARKKEEDVLQGCLADTEVLYLQSFLVLNEGLEKTAYGAFRLRHLTRVQESLLNTLLSILFQYCSTYITRMTSKDLKAA